MSAAPIRAWREGQVRGMGGMPHPALTWAGFIVFAYAALDIVAKTAGLYADFLGFWTGALRLIDATAVRMDLEFVVMALGITLFVWGIWGDRIRGYIPIGAMPRAPQESKPEVPDAVREELANLWNELHQMREHVTLVMEKSRTRNILRNQNRLLIQTTPRLNEASMGLDFLQTDMRVLLNFCKFTLGYQISAVVRRCEPKDIEEYFRVSHPDRRDAHLCARV